MSNSHDLCLSAFLDGETVDPSEVLRALDTAAGREALVEYARIRASIAQATPTTPEMSDRLRSVLPAGRRPLYGRTWTAAAALILCTLLGVWIGSSLGDTTSEQPPRAVRVIELQQDVNWR